MHISNKSVLSLSISHFDGEKVLLKCKDDLECRHPNWIVSSLSP